MDDFIFSLLKSTFSHFIISEIRMCDYDAGGMMMMIALIYNLMLLSARCYSQCLICINSFIALEIRFSPY